MRKIGIVTVLLALSAVGFFWVVTSPASLPFGNQSRAEKLAYLTETIPGWLEQYTVPGVSIAYIEKGSLVWAAAFGEQSPGVPAQPSTLYNVASLTKPITAEVVLSLADEGVFSIDSAMAEHWIDPDIADDQRHASLTPRLALQHQTGFPNWRYQTDNTLTFLHDPGTATSYSGEGFAYLAKYAEAVAKEPFETLAQRHVFSPAAAAEISFTRREWFEGRVAMPFRDGEYGTPVIRDSYNAADDIYATASDYAAVLIAIIQRSLQDTKIAAQRYEVIDDTKPFFCNIRRGICPLSDGYGLGWRVLRYENQTIVLHQGSDWGEQAIAVIRPEDQGGFVILTNGSNGNEVIRRVSDVLMPDPRFSAYARLQVF